MLKTQGLFIVVVVFLFVSTVTLSVLGEKVVISNEESLTFESDVFYNYYADVGVGFSNKWTDFGINFHVETDFDSDGLYLDINLSEVDEVVVRVQFNCSVFMNYSAGFPYVFFAPIAVIGFMVENYSEYHWASTRLVRDGVANWSDVIVFNISLDLEDAVDGGVYRLMLHQSIFTDPLLQVGFREGVHSLLFRFFYHLRNVDGGFFL